MSRRKYRIRVKMQWVRTLMGYENTKMPSFANLQQFRGCIPFESQFPAEAGFLMWIYKEMNPRLLRGVKIISIQVLQGL